MDEIKRLAETLVRKLAGEWNRSNHAEEKKAKLFNAHQQSLALLRMLDEADR